MTAKCSWRILVQLLIMRERVWLHETDTIGYKLRVLYESCTHALKKGSIDVPKRLVSS